MRGIKMRPGLEPEARCWVGSAKAAQLRLQIGEPRFKPNLNNKRVLASFALTWVKATRTHPATVLRWLHLFTAALQRA